MYLQNRDGMANSPKKIVTLSIYFILSIGAAFAQMGMPVPPGSTEVPIDGGVLGLLAAGAIYGAKKIYDRRKAQ